jgi:uncharacterized membrane protein
MSTFTWKPSSKLIPNTSSKFSPFSFTVLLTIANTIKLLTRNFKMFRVKTLAQVIELILFNFSEPWSTFVDFEINSNGQHEFKI